MVVTEPPRELRDATADLVHDGRLTFLPPMNRGQLFRWMGWADLFVLPSEAESFGLVGVEAMSAGTPVVVTDGCGLRHWVEPVHGAGISSRGHGWIAEIGRPGALAERIDEALADPQRLQETGMRAQAHVLRSFSWERNAATLLGHLGAVPREVPA